MFVITHAMAMLCRKTQQEINCLESGLESVQEDTQQHGDAED